MSMDGSQAQKEYVRECLQARQQMIALVKQELAKVEETLSKNAKPMLQRVQKLTRAQQETLVVQECKREAEERLSQEYLKLCQLPLVEEVIVRDGLIQIDTGTIHSGYGGKLHRIGNLILSIYPDGSLVIENPTAAVVGGKKYDHPYVVEGKVARPEVSALIASMICKGNFSELMEWLGDYLENYDAKRAICPIEAWPEATSAETRDLRAKELEATSGEFLQESDETKQSFIQVAAQPWQARWEERKKGLAEAEHDYEALYKQIERQQRTIDEMKSILADLESNAATEQEYREEYDLLCQLPGVREIKVKKRLIRVLTETIYIDHNGKRYNVGDFRIELKPGEGVKIRRAQNPFVAFWRGRDYYLHLHPHIGIPEKPCFGNIQHLVYGELTRCNFRDVILLCLEFLRSYDPEGTSLKLERDWIPERWI